MVRGQSLRTAIISTPSSNRQHFNILCKFRFYDFPKFFASLPHYPTNITIMGKIIIKIFSHAFNLEKGHTDQGPRTSTIWTLSPNPQFFEHTS